MSDFKLSIDNDTYYIEHLGRMDKKSYRERWYRKLETYKKLETIDSLITTTESEDKTGLEENVRRIIENIRQGKLQKTEGYSCHHYEI